MSDMRALELLAPAKNLEFGMEAINHGADAVYIGGPSFGARAAAGNSVADIAKLAEHAHRYHAQVFVALNTILRNDELAAAERLTHELYDAGVDALIVQDLGLLQLDLPPLALHASTQLDNRTPEKVKFLQDVGFSRVVLARELSLEQIRAVTTATDVEIEFFIHGALCVSYSGQCYISHAITGRSANRGACAQLCRVPCTLETKAGQQLAVDQHLLSLKDMNQTSHLAELAAAGVHSFKIEGRLKDLSYVKNVTAWYRQQLDALIEERSDWHKTSLGRCDYTFTPTPEKTFNRGSTDYFLQGRSADITSFDSPKFVGKAIGQVTRLGDRWLELSGTEPMHNGDGLCFFNARRELVGWRINKVEGSRLFFNEKIHPITAGTPVFRNRDQEFEKLLEKPSATRWMPVQIRCEELPEGFCVAMTDEHGCSVAQIFPLEKQPAEQAERMQATIQTQLAKLGNTPYRATDVSVSWQSPCFIPQSVLNQWRRSLVEAMPAAQLAAYQRPQRRESAMIATFPVSTLDYRGNVYNDAARAFYLSHGVTDIASAYELNEQAGEVPLMTTKHCLRYSFNQCPKEHGPGFKPDSLVLKMGKETFRLKFDCKRCEMQVLGQLKSGR